MASSILVNIYRDKAGNANLGASLTIFALMLLICEIVFYVQMKAQVKLFLASQKIKIQEKQLLSLLDSVPDKVLVCSLDRDTDLRPRPIYNNLRMQEFFGNSLVTTAERKKSDQKRKRKVRR